RLQGDGAAARLDAMLVVGPASAAEWLRTLWQQGIPVAPFGRSLLAGKAIDAGMLPVRSRQVCNCFDIAEDRIRAQLAATAGSAAERLAALQGALRCGTQCG